METRKLRPDVEAIRSLRAPDDEAFLVKKSRVSAAYANAMQIAIRELGGREFLTPSDSRLQDAVLAMVLKTIGPTVPSTDARADYAPQTQADTEVSPEVMVQEGIDELVRAAYPGRTVPRDLYPPSDQITVDGAGPGAGASITLPPNTISIKPTGGRLGDAA